MNGKLMNDKWMNDKQEDESMCEGFYEQKVNLISNQIKPVSVEIKRQAKEHWDRIAKPLESLGKLEELVIRMAAVQECLAINISKKALIIMCADNGIVEEGVTQTGQEVTAIVAENFLDEKSCVAMMCNYTGTQICPIDIGMAVDTPRVEKKKVRYGTANFAKGPAMSRQEAAQAIWYGIEKVEELSKKGICLIGTGEMGIGNTTTSSAITAVLLGQSVEEVTGRGAGLSSEGLERKIKAIQKGIQLNQPNKEDVLDVLSKVGGLDIAGLVGVFLGCSYYKIPVVVDGFIATVAAFCAMKIQPNSKDYLLASHTSKEQGARKILEILDLKPIIDGDLCLGEGSGAVLLFPLLDMAVKIFLEMDTFDGIQIQAYQPLK